MKRRNWYCQLVLFIVGLLLAILIIYPFVLVVSVSFSNETDILYRGYRLIPEHFDLAAYKYVFKNPGSIISAYRVTTIFSLISMVLGTLLMAMLAYPLTKKKLKGRNVINFAMFFTMLFNGGLVPTYILITQYLKLGDTIWVYILPALISPWYVFMMRTFFAGVPGEIYESALIDGANEFQIFFRMVLPLSKPVLATVALFTFLAKWNDWFTAMLYINKEELISLQYLLQRIMMNIQNLQEANTATRTMMAVKDIPTETARMAMAVVVAGPALLVFPFFQKYFVQGLTVGSVKG